MKADPRKMEMKIPGSHVLTFCHNIVYSFLFLYVSLSGIPLFILRTGCLGQAANSPRGVLNKFLLRGGSSPKVQPLTLLYVIFHEKGTPFVYLILRNRTPFSYLL